MNEKNAAKILVVDDEDRNLRMAKAMLIPMGYEILLARNGKEALETVAESPPDVILLDVMMPEPNGYEVAETLKSRESTRMIPIVMVTSLAGVEDRVKSLKIGVDDFLTKPIDKSELRARVASLVKVKAYYDLQRDCQTQLEKQVQEKTEELRTAYESLQDSSLETIFRLSRAAEHKDVETGAHLVRMSRIAGIVAEELGLSKEEQELILYSAPMHDIGKIGVPDHILLKPGQLDSHEWDIMKRHTTYGGEILGDSNKPLIHMAETIALTHHEKWDGSGYPKGLKGEAIPLEGRITAIADVFDALTSKRPYKDSYQNDAALAIIKEGRGIHFDPRIHDAFFARVEDVILVRDSINETEQSIADLRLD
jgi:cyclic di-GMP phosphodiesterase